jgi:LysR family transcriptional regulator, transcriptional activator for bauABCD operon
VYERSHELFDTVAKFAASTAAISDSTRGVLRIGAVDAVATNPALPLARALRRFRKYGRNVLIDFLTAGPEDLEAQVLHGKRDVVIGPYTERYATLAYVPLHAEEQSLYVAQGHALFGHAAIDRDMLDGHAFVSRRYLHSSDLMRVGLSDPQAIVDTMEAQLILILSGEYLGYLPDHYAQNWVDTGAVRAIRPDMFSYRSQFYAVSVKQRIPNPLVTRFIGLLVEG